jgi:hypothetical protein
MEPVPETERMDEFRDSPRPTLRLYDISQYNSQSTDRDESDPSKPPFVRWSTEPTPSSPHSPVYSSPTLPYRPRNTSPYSRSHLRSRSTASALAPSMSRAQSMPGVNSSGHLYMSSPTSPQRSSSPFGSPNRNRTPRKPIDEVFPGFSSRAQVIGESVPAIAEDDETPRSQGRSSSPNGLMPHNTFPRTRRPASPLRNIPLQHSTTEGLSPTTPTPLTSSPSYQNSKFNESISGGYNCPGSSTSSSVPSTPNSVRSRSPSISSLETIPDTPDAEEAALEAERIAQLKAAADAEDGDEAALENKRTGSLDNGFRGRTLGISYGSRDKRKRWSVCGAERRGDLDLETIWED